MRNKARKGVETQQAVNRCNLQAVIGLVKDYPLRDAHRLALKKTPFWPLIEAVVEKKLVPSHCRKRENVVEKIIHSYDPESKAFNFGGKKVRMTKDDVRLIFGISCGNKEFPNGTWNKGTVKLSTEWNIPGDRLELTKIKTLLKRFIKGDNQNDIDHVARLVCLFLCGSLFFANTGTTVKWVYVHCMEDLEKVKEYDWAGAVIDYLLKSIHKEHQNPIKVKGCSLLLMYYLCEHTNILDQQNADAIPRLLKWDIPKLLKSLKDIKELEHLSVDQVNDGILEETVEERNIYNMQLAEAASEKFQASLSEDLQISQRENSSANQKISSLNDMYMQEYNTRLQEENRKLQLELATTNETLKRVEKEKAAAVENLSTLRGHYTSLQDELTTSQISSHDMYMQMQEYNTRLQEENSKLQSELATTNETLKLVEKEKAVLQDQLTTSRVSLYEAGKQKAALVDEVGRLRADLQQLREDSDGRLSQAQASAQVFKSEKFLTELDSLLLKSNELEARCVSQSKLIRKLHDQFVIAKKKLQVSQDEAVKQKEALVDEVRRLSLEQVREDGDDRLSQVQPLARKSLVELDPLALKTNELEARFVSQIELIRTVQGQLAITKRKLQMSDLSALEEQRKLMHELRTTLAESEVIIIEGENLRKKLHNALLELKGNIRVFCRVRPLLPEDGVNAEPGVFSYPTALEVLGRGIDLMQNVQKHSFAFDKVFMPDASQEEVFVEISQLVQSALDGYKVCIFAYGRTGSGKTYTMMGRPGSPDQKGLIPRSLEQIFQTKQSLQQQGWKYDIQVSMLEIYNDSIRDLLSANRSFADIKSPANRSNRSCFSPASRSCSRTENSVAGKKYPIKHDANGNTVVSDLTIVNVHSSREVSNLLDQAAQSRSVGKTQMNEQSSRSHFVFTLQISGYNESTDQQVRGVLNLIDLAGSERLSRSGAIGDRLKETQAINKSLSSLSDVIFALARKEDHVPFRNSKLTYLLQPCLGGDSKTLMVVNVSPDPSSVVESLCSLRFAARVNACEIGIPQRQTNNISKILNSSLNF